MQSNKKNLQQVKVYVRPRPMNRQEIESRNHSVILHSSKKELRVKNGLNEKKYVFDGVFTETDSQREVYNTVVAPLIGYIISGYNCTVFAYGQTGTGKTHTMTGSRTEGSEFHNDPQLGIIPRAGEHLFNELCKLDQKIEYTVTVSFIEIYNEEVRDLLILNNNVPLRIYEDPDNKGSVCIKGLKEVTVCNCSEIYDWLNFGNIQRQTASTNMNRHSSRSHTVLTISVHTRQLTLEGEQVIKTGKLHIVDLAGSENIGRSGATDVRAFEAGTINKSLLTLGKVIKNLAQKTPHIPYRDSKLTRILQDSLGGKTKTCMIATITPAINSWDETLSTLDYANVARSVANCPQVNENRQQANLLTNLKAEITRLQKDLEVARTGNGFYMSSESYAEIVANLEKQKAEKIESRKRQSELLKQLEELQEAEIAKRLEYENIKSSFEETKRYMDELKIEKENSEKEIEYQKKNLEIAAERQRTIKKITEQLVNLCDMSTKHQIITHEKYEAKCAASVKNAVAAHAIHNSSLAFLDEFQQKLDKYSLNSSNSLNLLNMSNSTVKDITSKINEDLNKVSQELTDNMGRLNQHSLTGVENVKEFLTELNLNNKIESDVANTRKALDDVIGIKDVLNNDIVRISKELKSTMSSQVGAEKSLLKNFSDCREVYVKHTNVLKSQLENQRNQWQNLMKLPLDEIPKYIAANIAEINAMESTLNELDEIPKHIDKATKIYRENFSVEEHSKKVDFMSTTLSNEVKKLTPNVVQDQFEELLSKITQHNQEISKSIETTFEKIDSETSILKNIVNDIIHTTDVDRANLSTAIDNLDQISTSYNDVLDLHTQFVGAISDRAQDLKIHMENEFQNKVTFESHAGDTPAKPAYSRERYPFRQLVEEFNETLKDADCSLLNANGPGDTSENDLLFICPSPEKKTRLLLTDVPE